ncbi:MAG: hypothetical protein U5K00_12905 [Melioribacteraceae bacterium]|nr:hypothetical protein [Melioribacteraceae bacterium]
MKKLLFVLFLSAQFVFVTAQTNYTLDLQVTQVAAMDFAPFLFSNDLSGAPRIFAVTISPEEGDVKIRGELFWKKDQNSGFEWMMTFRTRTFTARSFFNTDLGSTIRMGRNETDSDLIDENRKRGKPSGEYRLDLYLLDVNNNQLAFDQEFFEFSNPAQTISIRLPQSGSIENIGGVLAEWDFLEGIQYYQILANVREDRSQSLEDALESGDPLINSVNVGLSTSVNLRTILTREWLPGQEVVLQVSALPVGGNPNELIKSDIVNFYLDDPANPTNERTSEELQALLQTLHDNLGSELLDRLLNGDANITDIVDEETGLSLSPDEIQALIAYLKENPDNLIKIEKD